MACRRVGNRWVSFGVPSKGAWYFFIGGPLKPVTWDPTRILVAGFTASTRRVAPCCTMLVSPGYHLSAPVGNPDRTSDPIGCVEYDPLQSDPRTHPVGPQQPTGAAGRSAPWTAFTPRGLEGSQPSPGRVACRCKLWFPGSPCPFVAETAGRVPEVWCRTHGYDAWMPGVLMVRPLDTCPDCDQPTRAFISHEPALFFHGGYGATRTARRLTCRCGWDLITSVTTTRPI